MLLLDSEAISSVAHGPDLRRDRVRAHVAEMRSRDLPIETVVAVLAEVVRGRLADAGVFAGLRRERVEVHPVDSRVGVRAGQLRVTYPKRLTSAEALKRAHEAIRRLVANRTIRKLPR